MGIHWTLLALTTLYLVIPGYVMSPTNLLMTHEDLDLASLHDFHDGEPYFEKPKRDLTIIDHASEISSSVGQMVKKGLQSTGKLISNIGGGFLSAISAILASDEGHDSNPIMPVNASMENSGDHQQGTDLDESKKSKRDLSMIDHVSDITSSAGQMFKKGLQSTGTFISHVGGGFLSAISAILASDEGHDGNSTMPYNASMETTEFPAVTAETPTVTE